MQEPTTDNSKASALKRLIDAGKKDREHWLKQGDEIARYSNSDDYGFIYQEFDPELTFKARVNKASEFKQIIGPYLYPQNPDAAVNSEDWADEWQKKRHQIEERYCDYAARHGNLAVHMKRAVDHALEYGRATLWCGYNDHKGIIQNIFDTSDRLLIDPDARTSEEINWQSRKRVKPRWELLQKYPDQKAVIEQLPVYAKDSKDKKQTRSDDHASELVEYYECWMGVGIENYDPSLEVIGADLASDISAKQKFCVADGHILHGGDWEIPFFLIDAWPGEMLDLLEKPGCLWPTQPMEPGMGHLRAMNYLYTLFIAKYRLMSRTPFARMTINGQQIETDQLHKLIKGDAIDILNVCVNGNENVKISDLFQRIDWGDPVPGFERIWMLVSKEFEKSTGLYELLYSGSTPTQIRTATAAELIESKSKTRIDAFRESVVKYMERVYRKTLFAARYLHNSEDISKLFGPKAGQIWGELGSPENVAQESALRDQLLQGATAQGMPEEQAEDMLGPPQFVSMDQWITEADRTIDAGSMRRLDIDSQLQNLNVAMNQLGPAVVNMPGGGAFVASLAEEFTRINRFSPELQEAAKKLKEAMEMNTQIQMQQMMAPPMPMPGAPGAPPDTTQSAPNPSSGPMAGPMGGEPMEIGDD